MLLSRKVVTVIRWAAAPASWRGPKVIGLGLGVFIVAGIVLFVSASFSALPYLQWPLIGLGSTAGFVGWAIVLLGVIGSLRAYARVAWPPAQRAST